MQLLEVQAQSHTSCAGSDRTYLVRRGDTLSGIAYRYGTNWSVLASHNHIAHPNLIYVNQRVCIPIRRFTPTAPERSIETREPAIGYRNLFPYPACTWWANQRYYQLHGVYVPWTINSNAWQWTARAYQFGWRVSRTPVVGAIMVLQPGVQYASRYGHVAVVEKILGNGRIVASSMSWGQNPRAITTFLFTPGRGVTFIYR